MEATKLSFPNLWNYIRFVILPLCYYRFLLSLYCPLILTKKNYLVYISKCFACIWLSNGINLLLLLLLLPYSFSRTTEHMNEYKLNFYRMTSLDTLSYVCASGSSNNSSSRCLIPFRRPQFGAHIYTLWRYDMIRRWLMAKKNIVCTYIYMYGEKKNNFCTLIA